MQLTERTDLTATPIPTYTPTPTRRAEVRDADGMAVASFILGLLGLLVLNVFLGPIAIVLASVALWRGTARRGRAFLGLGLGIADLLVLVAFMQFDSTVSWSF
ncbi:MULTISPECIES: DUF4190 domain-containing protein [unclassified Streptomyces]|uniref:DUF4190 domain-containing protein n=1 Tax=unclassified Streptomyces TaxID=2593676 RepID=UPI003864BDF6